MKDFENLLRVVAVGGVALIFGILLLMIWIWLSDVLKEIKNLRDDVRQFHRLFAVAFTETSVVYRANENKTFLKKNKQIQLR